MKPKQNEVLRRSFELRADAFRTEGHGGFSGVANVMGVLDSWRSVIFPGAYSPEVLREFEKTGFITKNHDWKEDVATIQSANSQGRELRISAEFHSDEESQKTRTKMQERAEREKMVGLSVGFSPDWSKVEDFDSGEKLLTYAKGCGADLTLFDPKLAEFKGYCWAIPTVSRLYEVAITSAPATPGSMADTVRSLNQFLNDESLHAGMTLEDHLNAVRAAVLSAESRLVDLAQSREDDGRKPFIERVPQIMALRDSLSALLERCEAQNNEPNDIRREIDDFLLDVELASF